MLEVMRLSDNHDLCRAKSGENRIVKVVRWQILRARSRSDRAIPALGTGAYSLMPYPWTSPDPCSLIPEAC